MPLRVVHRAPVGLGTAASRILVVFNQAMVSLSGVNRPMASDRCPLLTRPAVRGDCRYVTDRAVRLEPRHGFAVATRYEAWVAPSVRALSGARLIAGARWSFETPRARVESITAWRRSPVQASHLDPRDGFSVWLNHPVAPAALARVLRVTRASTGRPIDVRVQRAPREPRRLRVVPRGALPAGAEVTVRVAPGLRSLGGTLPARTGKEQRFRVRGPLRVVVQRAGPGATTRETECAPLVPYDEGGVELRFSEPVTRRALLGALRIWPRPRGLARLLAPAGLGWWGASSAPTETATAWCVAGGIPAGAVARVRLGEALGDVWGQRLARAVTVEVRIPHASPSVFLPRGGLAFFESWRPLTLETLNLKRLRRSWTSVRGAAATAQILSCRLPGGQHARRGGRPATPRGHRGWADRCLRAAIWRVRERDVRGVRDHSRARPVGAPLGLSVVRVSSPQVRDKDGREVPHLWWGVRTDLGLRAWMDPGGVTAWVTSLRSGRPLRGVAVRVVDPAGRLVGQAVTGRDGLLCMGRRDLEAALGGRAPPSWLVVARRGQDEAFVMPGGWAAWRRLEGGAVLDNEVREAALWEAHSERDAWRGDRPAWVGHVATERSVYRPGQTALLHGAVREVQGGRVRARAGVRLVARLMDPGGVTLGRVHLQTDAWGVFLGRLRLPRHGRRGRYHVVLWHGKRPIAGREIQLLDYRAPRFRVSLKLPRTPPVGDGVLSVRGEARFDLGAPLAGARYTVRVRREPEVYTWPRWAQFVAGVEVAPPEAGRGAAPLEARGLLSQAGVLDRHLPLSAPGEPPVGWPLRLEATLRVTSRAQRQAHATATGWQLPGNRLVAVRLLQPRHGLVRLWLRVLTRAGRSVGAPRVRLSLLSVAPNPRPDGEARVQWRTPLQTRRIRVGRQGTLVRLRVDRALRGRQLVVWLRVRDAAGRTAHTTVWVRAPAVSSASGLAAGRRGGRRDLRVRLDRERYAVGDTARVSVWRGPTVRSAVLLVQRERVFSVVSLHFDARGWARARVRVRGAYRGGVSLHVVGVRAGAALRSAHGPVAEAGALLVVDDRDERLRVSVAPGRRRYRPGEVARIRLLVRDELGHPVRARVVLMAVDEAVLRLGAYRLPDPHADLVRQIPAAILSDDVRAHLGRLSVVKRGALCSSVACEEEDSLGALMGHTFADASGLGGLGRRGSAALGVRRVFRTTILHRRVTTDRAGRATVSVRLPHSLTQFRIMAFAVDDGRGAGTGRGWIRVVQPLVSVTALPRFLRVGDRARAGVLVLRHGGAAGPVSVGLRVRGRSLALAGPHLRRVQLPAHQGRTVRFALRALRPGAARLSFDVRGRQVRDGLAVRLSVRRTTTGVWRGVAGATRGAVAHDLGRLGDLRGARGRLQVALGGDALVGARGSVRQLLRYPHHCAEQTASRLIALAILARFGASWGLLPMARLRAQLRAELTRLSGMQSAGGLFRYWPGHADPDPLVTAYGLVALRVVAEASRASGVRVDPRLVGRAEAALRAWILRKRRRDLADLSTEAMALYAVDGKGRGVQARLRALMARRWELPPSSRALLLAALVRAGGGAPLRAARRQLGVELAGGLHITGRQAWVDERLDPGGGRGWGSVARSTAMVLLGLALATPHHPLVPRLVRWLLETRPAGAYETTQEAAWKLLALSRVAGSPRQAPRFVARVFVGSEPLLAAKIARPGQPAVRRQVDVAALAEVLRRGSARLIFERRGRGTLYYQASLQLRVDHLPTRPRDRGIRLSRQVTVLSASGWPLRRARAPRLGDTVRVRLRLRVASRGRYLAVVDPLPAGLEPLEPELAGVAGWDHCGGRSLEALAYDRRELHDDRVLFYRNRPVLGPLSLCYLARVTTPGRFLWPPATARFMYAPEVHGATAARWLRVKTRGSRP